MTLSGFPRTNESLVHIHFFRWNFPNRLNPHQIDANEQKNYLILTDVNAQCFDFFVWQSVELYYSTNLTGFIDCSSHLAVINSAQMSNLNSEWILLNKMMMMMKHSVDFKYQKLKKWQQFSTNEVKVTSEEKKDPIKESLYLKWRCISKYLLSVTIPKTAVFVSLHFKSAYRL